MRAVTERQIQEQLIQHLTKKEGYKLYKSNMYVEELNDIFFRNVERLNRIELSNSEKERLLLNMEVQPVDAYKQFRHGVELIRDDNSTVILQLVDMSNIENNEFGVMEELKIKALQKMRLDVVIILNGIPLLTMELKRPANEKGVKDAIKDLNKYNRNGAYRTGLLKFLQIYAASDDIATRYFAVSAESPQVGIYGSGFPWTDEQNNKINRLVPQPGKLSFAETFLTRQNLYNIFRRYMLCVEGASPKIMVLRPYQIFAVEAGMERLNQTHDNGFFWHATGSGKTLTSFMLTKEVENSKKFDKVVMLLDRNDLATQTVEEYSKFDGEHRQIVKGYKLKQAFTDPSIKTIITTIQSFSRLLVRTEKDRNVNQQLARNIAFVIDECHRSTFGSMFQQIKRRTEKAQFIGFTGTPILAENKTPNDQITTTIFGEPIHIYTVQNAIEDKNVLHFSLREVKVTSSDPSIKRGEEYYRNPSRINEISNYIAEGLHKHTKQGTERKNLENGFTAMLACDSIPSAYKYWEAITDKLNQQNRNTALIFSIPAKGDTNEDESPALEWLLKAVQHYDIQFKTNFRQTMLADPSEGRKSYLADLMRRVKTREIDLLIVSDMLLTGFDAQTLNTIYIDKNLQYHGLLQAMSRTNRTYHTASSTRKKEGIVYIFNDREMQDKVDDTIRLYSNGGNVNTVVERKTYCETLNETYQILQQLKTEYPDPDNISKIRDIKQLIRTARQIATIRRNIQFMQTFDEWDSKQSWTTLGTDETELSEYIASIVNRRDEITTDSSEDEDTAQQLAELDYIITSGKETLIDLAYINELLNNMVLSPEEEKQAWADKIRKSVQNSSDPTVKKRSKAITEVLSDISDIQTEQDFWDKYDEAIKKQIDKALKQAQQDFKLSKGFLKKAVEYNILSDGLNNLQDLREELLKHHPEAGFFQQQKLLQSTVSAIQEIAELTTP